MTLCYTHLMSDKIFYVKTCPRCEKGAKYIIATPSYIKNLNLKWSSRCKYCKPISDENLEAFKKSCYIKQCPKCGRDVHFKQRVSYLASVRANSPCKSCVNLETALIKAEEERKIWEPIIGYWGMSHNTFIRIKKHWLSLTEDQKTELIGRTPKQRRYYWDHLKRKNAAEGHRKCREIINQKYSGDNHWMKRPEVLQKIRKSCEKYRGDGHWFRRNRDNLTG